MTTTLINAAKALVDAITFDDSGIMGRGGNGGLISRETIRKADELRLAIDGFEGDRANRKTPPEGTIPPDSAWQPEHRT